SLVYASTTLVCSSQLEGRAHCIAVSMATGEQRVSKVRAGAPGAQLMGEWSPDLVGCRLAGL
ncbi:hypothetical protein GBF38_013006, partial [Nibea albiflora]